MRTRITVLLALALVTVGGPTALASPGAQASRTSTSPAQADIRPGVSIFSNVCTANFVFSAVDNDSLYIGSAGHCFTGVDVGTEVSIAGIEDAGELAYCGLGPASQAECPPPDCEELLVVALCSGVEGVDVALVEIDEAYHDDVHPAMLGFGGPQAVDEEVARGEKVFTFGNSAYRDSAGDRLDAREGYVSQPGNGSFQAYFAGPGVPGDSGSPVVTADGGAGILVTLGIVPPADNGAVSLTTALERFEQADAVEVQLETASLTDGGVLPATGS